MKVEELMTKECVAVQASESLNDAANLMWERDCGAIPVVDGERGPIGMVTDRDICMSAYRHGKDLKQLEVSDAMSNQVVSCAPSDDVAEAQGLMRAARVRRLPVVDEHGRLSGMLSLGNIACALGNEGVGSESKRQVGETLAVISEPTVVP